MKIKAVCFMAECICEGWAEEIGISLKKNEKARQRGNCELIKRGGKANLIMAFHLQTRRHLSRVQDTLSQAKQTANEVSFFVSLSQWWLWSLVSK